MTIEPSGDLTTIIYKFVREKERDFPTIHSLPHMPVLVMARLGLNLGSQSKCLTWVTGAQLLESSLLPLRICVTRKLELCGKGNLTNLSKAIGQASSPRF